MKQSIFGLIFLTVCAGCGGSNINYDKAATQTGINQETLKQNCKGLICNYDELKDRLEVTAITYDMAFGHSGSIEYQWSQGSETIQATATHQFLYGSWKFIDKAEIYIQKELIAVLDSANDQVLGDWNSVTATHTKIESVWSSLTIDQANRLAQAEKDSVTVRFYGQDGYTDIEFPKIKNLDKAVKLALLTR